MVETARQLGILVPRLLDAPREVTGIDITLRARLLPDVLRIAVLAAALCGLVLVMVVMARTHARICS